MLSMYHIMDINALERLVHIARRDLDNCDCQVANAITVGTRAHLQAL